MVFASELLRQAEQLVAQHVHPMTIIQGFREACEAAKKALEETARDAGNEEKFKEDLTNLSRRPL